MSKRLGLLLRAGVMVFVLAGAALMVVAPSASAVTGAQSTTVDTAMDGSGHCRNGSGVPNSNLYDGKRFVWFSGLTVQASLGAGTYIWAGLRSMSTRSGR